MNESIKNTINEYRNKYKNNYTKLLLKSNHFPEIVKLTSFLSDNATIRERIFCIEHDLTKKPTCIQCGKPLNFIRDHYPTYCSKRCGMHSPIVQNKIKQTSLKRYGVENAMQNEEVRKRMEDTHLEKYGHKYGFQTETAVENRKKTNLERYGSENIFNNPDIQKKIKETNIERYGTEHPSQNEEIKKKTIQTNLKKYGVESTFQIEEVKNIRRDATIQKWKTIASSLNFELLDYNLGVFTFKCGVCGNIFSISRQTQIICRKCHPYSASNGERELLEFVKELGVDVIARDRKTIFPKELDLLIPDYQETP